MGVFIETRQIGNLLRVAAIDEATGREVVVSGPLHSEEQLTRTALKKLEYMLKKEE